MKPYSSLALSSSAWPDPMESVYQALPARHCLPAAPCLRMPGDPTSAQPIGCS